MSPADADRIYLATTQRRMHLVRTVGGYRWSEFRENDNNPRHDDFAPGCAVFASPEAAIMSLHLAAGFLVLGGMRGEVAGG